MSRDVAADGSRFRARVKHRVALRRLTKTKRLDNETRSKI